MDRRLTPANARAALEVLRGQVEAPRFVKGEPASITRPLVDLCVSPGGKRDRQMLLGDRALVIDRHESWAFVQMEKDGFCGYLPEAALGPAEEASHWLSAPASHLYPEPNLKAREIGTLCMNARLRVLSEYEKWVETSQGFVPKMHVKPLGEWHKDPVAVAQTFLGVPYLWGGNSRAGLDCSGLVQTARLACGRPCAGDSDLQEAESGAPLSAKAALKRGDLIFWQGHVALAMNADYMIHATAAFMAVVVEPTKAAMKRILAAGDGPVTSRKRPG
jgi:cell wall-associated NlpC family hydrolase